LTLLESATPNVRGDTFLQVVHRQPESTVVARWLGAVSLIAAAEDAARAQDPALNTVAVASAHSACEAMLGLIAGTGSKIAPREERFRQLLDRAIEAVPSDAALPAQLQTDLVDLNDVRNFALHRGVAVADPTALRATLTARALLDFLPRVIDVDDLPGGAGLTRAVAQRVEIPMLRACLERAEDLLRAHDHVAAADNLAGAFALVVGRAELPDSRRFPDRVASFGLGLSFGQSSDRALSDLVRVLERPIKNLSEASRRDEKWILRIGLGMSRANLARLQSILGDYVIWNDQHQPVVNRDEAKPTLEDVTWAIARVTEIVYRLWYAGSLDKSWWERQADEKAAKAAAATSAEPKTGPPSPPID
jgi:hypothetical protein